MKRDRVGEGEQRLATSEALLRKSLIDLLPSVARVGSPFFTNSRYNAHGLPRHFIDDEAEAILELALACVELREHLGVDVRGSVGHLFLCACEEASSLNEHRRGPRKLAESLLQRLGNDG